MHKDEMICVVAPGTARSQQMYWHIGLSNLAYTCRECETRMIDLYLGYAITEKYKKITNNRSTNYR